MKLFTLLFFVSIISFGQTKTVETLRVEERAAAKPDKAGYGQIWVKDDTPNTLYFTDDTGTDVQLGVGGGNITSGLFSPVVTGETNITGTPGFVSGSARYSRVNDIVTVSVILTFTPSASSTFTEVRMSLPIPSSISGIQDVTGSWSNQLGTAHGAVRGDSSNNEAIFTYTSTGTTTVNVYAVFQYTIL